MIDYKLSVKNEKDAKLFNLLSQVQQQPQPQKDLETLPYFLTEEFTAVINQEQLRSKTV